MEIIVAAALGAIAVVAAPLATVLAYAKQVQRDVVKQEQLQSNEERRALYTDFLDSLFGQMDLTKQSRSAQAVSRMQKDLESTFRRFRSRIALVGSDDVVRAFNNFNVYNMNREPSEADRHQIMMRYADLMKAMRKDLGYPETDLNRLDMLGVFITDAESLEVAATKEYPRRFANTRSL